ncbi:MAG: class I SAM-dependent methyltransferase [Chloroflexi bacterium]|nr:class I SAM-dependent methyltransferase [Chloroflexota bacterium]
MPLLKHFNWIAPHYEAWIGADGNNPIATLAALPTPGRLLDAGGGTGRVSNYLRDLAGQVVVADESFGMLHQAVALHALPAAEAEVEALPFPAASFDRILMVDAFHHLRDQRQTAGELWRVLAEGGRIVIEEPDVRKLSVKLTAIAEKLLLMRSHIWKAEDIRELFDNLGAATRLHQEGFRIWVIAEKHR